MASSGFSLTPSERCAVEETWNIVAKDLKAASVIVFVRFLTKYPHHQKKFRAFSNLPLEELPGNKRFQAHTFTAVSALDGIVRNLEDEEMTGEMLVKTGERHVKNGVSAKDISDFCQVLVHLLKEESGDLWTELAGNGWKKVADFVCLKVDEGMSNVTK